VRFDQVLHELVLLFARPWRIDEAARDALQQRRQQRDQMLAIFARLLRLHAPDEIFDGGDRLVPRHIRPLFRKPASVRLREEA